MTEAEWLACDDPRAMLRLLGSETSDRKLRLFFVVCCRRMWHLLIDERSRAAVEMAELIADELASEQDRIAANAAADQACRAAVLSRQDGPEMYILAARAAGITVYPKGIEAGMAFVSACRLIARDPTSGLGGKQAEMVACCIALREIFSNPFRPVSFAPDWRTSTAISLAQGMYDSRDFTAMPILADSLQDAGCEHADILTHCRDEKQVHVRGCWVVDLVLGKM